MIISCCFDWISCIFDDCLYQMHTMLIPLFTQFRDSDSYKLVRCCPLLIPPLIEFGLSGCMTLIIFIQIDAHSHSVSIQNYEGRRSSGLFALSRCS